LQQPLFIAHFEIRIVKSWRYETTDQCIRIGSFHTGAKPAAVFYNVLKRFTILNVGAQLLLFIGAVRSDDMNSERRTGIKIPYLIGF